MCWTLLTFCLYWKSGKNVVSNWSELEVCTSIQSVKSTDGPNESGLFSFLSSSIYLFIYSTVLGPARQATRGRPRTTGNGLHQFMASKVIDRGIQSLLESAVKPWILSSGMAHPRGEEISHYGYIAQFTGHRPFLLFLFFCDTHRRASSIKRLAFLEFVKLLVKTVPPPRLPPSPASAPLAKLSAPDLSPFHLCLAIGYRQHTDSLYTNPINLPIFN